MDTGRSLPPGQGPAWTATRLTQQPLLPHLTQKREFRGSRMNGKLVMTCLRLLVHIRPLLLLYFLFPKDTNSKMKPQAKRFIRKNGE